MRSFGRLQQVFTCTACSRWCAQDEFVSDPLVICTRKRRVASEIREKRWFGATSQRWVAMAFARRVWSSSNRCSKTMYTVHHRANRPCIENHWKDCLDGILALDRCEVDSEKAFRRPLPVLNDGTVATSVRTFLMHRIRSYS